MRDLNHDFKLLCQRTGGRLAGRIAQSRGYLPGLEQGWLRGLRIVSTWMRGSTIM